MSAILGHIQNLGAMMITYKCMKCGAAMESPVGMAGREEECPECGTRTRVPAPGPRPNGKRNAEPKEGRSSRWRIRWFGRAWRVMAILVLLEGPLISLATQAHREDDYDEPATVTNVGDGFVQFVQVNIPGPDKVRGWPFAFHSKKHGFQAGVFLLNTVLWIAVGQVALLTGIAFINTLLYASRSKTVRCMAGPAAGVFTLMALGALVNVVIISFDQAMRTSGDFPFILGSLLAWIPILTLCAIAFWRLRSRVRNEMGSQDRNGQEDRCPASAGQSHLNPPSENLQ